MTGILAYLLVTGLLVLSSALSTIRNGILTLNHYQLKLRAQRGDQRAKIMYPLHMMKFQLYIVASFLSLVVNACIVLLLRENIGSLFALIVGASLLLILTELIPMVFLRERVETLIVISAPVLRKILGFVSPVTRPLARYLEQRNASDIEKLFTKEQLVTILEKSAQVKESDLSKDELRMLHGALGFSDKLIRDVMTPRRMVRVVAKDDEVGPLLMDELHRSGHSRFPVTIDAEHTDFVGTLYLRDLVGQKVLKKVSDIMSADVRYIHEEESLDYALRAFLKLRHHLFIVVNNFEEFVGVLTIEDVLEEIIGIEIVDEFDAHDDLRAVAARIANKERARREKHAEKAK